MTPVQGSLFPPMVERGASRQRGPATARAAARSMSGDVLRSQQRTVLEVVGDDATAYEVVVAIGARGGFIQQNVAARRLFELEERGMVRRTDETRPGYTARELIVFAVTDAGREYLRDRGAA